MIALGFDPLGGNAANFSETFASSGITVASGDSTPDLVWSSHFDGNADEQDFYLALFAFDDVWWSGPIQTAVARWNGESWRFASHAFAPTWEEFSNRAGLAHAAAPSSAFLAALGFGGLWFGRRYRRTA